MRDKKTVSLVLGGGGARGLAHIGVIEWLRQNGFEIRSIAGSSMGALIGGIYAAGKLDVYKHWVMALNKSYVLRLLGPRLGRSGLFKGMRVIETLLRDLVGERNIEDLPISFTAVATDLEEQKEVWLNRGPLFDAIRASIAVPLVFTPHKINGRRLLDGSLINPLPIAPTLGDDTNLTIAVILGGPPEDDTPLLSRASEVRAVVAGSNYRERIKAFVEELQQRFRPEESGQRDRGYFNIIALSMETMQNTITRLQLAAYTPDVTITIARNAARPFEFYRANELIELGREKAERMLGKTGSERDY